MVQRLSYSGGGTAAVLLRSGGVVVSGGMGWQLSDGRAKIEERAGSGGCRGRLVRSNGLHCGSLKLRGERNVRDLRWNKEIRRGFALL